jgi:hypothetical protein
VAEIIAVVDLPSSIQSAELVQAMIDGANAKASRVAPCLASVDPVPSLDLLSEARLVLIGAVKRWAEAGAGSVQSQQAGPFGMSVDTRQRTGFNLWPSEITALQDLCKTSTPAGAFSITPTPATSAHMPWCALMMGASYCSCGADLANYEYPLYEGGVLSGDDY